MKNWNCLLCGVGGQGTVLAAKLIAYAAMKKGMQVRNAETIGMAQRGGSVVSHVRYGAQIETPLIPEHSADVMIAFVKHHHLVLLCSATELLSATLAKSLY